MMIEAEPGRRLPRWLCCSEDQGGFYADLRGARLCKPAASGAWRQGPIDRRPKGARMREARRQKRSRGLAPHPRHAEGNEGAAGELICRSPNRQATISLSRKAPAIAAEAALMSWTRPDSSF